MESNSVCNQTSDQQNRMTVKRESDSLITSMITDRIARHEVLLPINHNQYNFRKKIHLEQISPIETISQGKYFSIVEIPQFFPRISTCCYGYCDQFCDWWI